MNTSISDIQKRRGRPPTGQTPIVALRLSAELRKGVDAAIADQAVQVSRSEYIRRLIAEHLLANGYLGSMR